MHWWLFIKILIVLIFSKSTNNPTSFNPYTVVTIQISMYLVKDIVILDLPNPSIYKVLFWEISK